MAVIPTFSQYAQTPDSAGAYLGGAQLVQRKQIADQEFAAQMARVQADRASAEMQNQARMAALQQETLQKAQEMEIEKAYQQSMIGLKERDLQRQQEAFELEAQGAARTFQAQEQMRMGVEKAIASGMSPRDAFVQQATMFGPQAGLPAGAYNDLLQPPEAEGGGIGPAALQPVEGSDDYMFFQTGKGSRQLVKKEAEVPEGVVDIPGTGYQRFGEKILPKREDAETRELRADRKRLKDAMSGKDTAMHRMSIAASKDPKAKLSATDKYLIEEYKGMQQQLDEIDKLLKGADVPSGRTTNTIGRFKVY